jgi:hypothetical protein
LNYRGANPGVSNLRLTGFEGDEPEYALPGARYRRWLSAAIALEMSGERTFSVEPQKGTIGFPFGEDTSLEKPLRCLLAMGAAGNVVVNRRIWRRDPFAKVLS